MNTAAKVPVKLGTSSVAKLASTIDTPAYDRAEIVDGIVHIGVGGFHRAHQAVYVDDVLQQNEGGEWGICGVGLLKHDTGIRDALTSQDCLYTVVERATSGEDHARVVGSITRFLFAPDDREAVIEKMASADTRIVSMTITEGGYCFNEATGELVDDHPTIAHDLQHPDQPSAAYGYLTAALDRRRQRGMKPFTVMSCDNIQSNGNVVKKLLLRFAELRDPALAEWLSENGAFPNSMVDRITPATTDADKTLVRDKFGIDDAWPIVTEPFKQWVIEDDFCDGRPSWEQAGAQLTGDVHPYEMMKIRLLNASHSAMGYLGYLAGFEYIYQIMADEKFRKFIRDFMDQEVTALLAPVPGIDLDDYKQTLIERFANPTIKDKAARICLDGSAKMPKFILPSIREQLQRGGPTKRLSLVVASWCRYAAGTDEQGNPITIEDPMAETLTRQAGKGGKDPQPFLEINEVFGDELASSTVFVAQVKEALSSLYDEGATATLNKYL